MSEDKACRELEPCPFCGGAAHITKGWAVEQVWAHGEFHRVFCGACQARQLFHKTECEAIAAWNRRAAKPAVPEGFRLIPSDAVAMLLHKFERAGGPFKVAHFGVELGASSWASNVENALAALSAAPTPPEAVKEPTI